MKTTILLFCFFAMATTGAISAKEWQWSNNIIDDSKVSWTWTSLQWPQQSKFSILRAQIDKESQEGKLTPALLEERKQAFAKDPTDNQRLFAWAYSSWAIIKPQTEEDTFYNLLQPPSTAMRQLPAITDYEYIRLRFLTETNFSDSSKLKSVGARLLQFNRNDYEVEFQLSQVLSASDESQDRSKSLYHAKHLLNLYPLKPNVYDLMGSFYLDSFLNTLGPTTTEENRRNGLESIKYYQKYLELAPLDYVGRKAAQNVVAKLEKNLNVKK